MTQSCAELIQLHCFLCEPLRSLHLMRNNTLAAREHPHPNPLPQAGEGWGEGGGSTIAICFSANAGRQQAHGMLSRNKRFHIAKTVRAQGERGFFANTQLGLGPGLMRSAVRELETLSGAQTRQETLRR